MLIVIAVVSTTVDALNKEPANVPNLTFEQTPHTPNNQEPIPRYTLVDSINASSTATAAYVDTATRFKFI